MKRHARKLLALPLGIALLSLTSCNIFDPFDSPTSDAQLISAARACFNKGDIACAQADYEKLSADNADIKNSEEAFTTLEGFNAGMGAFIAAFGQGDISTGKALTSMANSIGSSASQANRVEIFKAYQKAALVVDTRLRGLSRFVTALALGAELLAENAAVKGDLQVSDIANDASFCKTQASVGVLNSSPTDPCASPTTGTRPFTTYSPPRTAVAGGLLDAVDLTNDVDQTTASVEVFNSAVNTLNDALLEMGVTNTNANVGGFSGIVGGIAVSDGVGGGNAPLYRQALLQQGIGR